MKDLIEKQAALDEIMEELKDRSLHDDEETSEDFADGYDEGIRNAATRVYLMPSAQPEQISDPDRVYDELSKVYNMKDLSDEVYSIIGDLMLSLHEPERKKGKWIKIGKEKTGALNITYNNLRCSNCGYSYGFPFKYKFCPECGADMREE